MRWRRQEPLPRFLLYHTPLSLCRSEQPTADCEQDETRDKHGHVDKHWSNSAQPSRRCLMLAADLRGRGRPRGPVGEAGRGGTGHSPMYYELNREPLVHSCARLETIASICVPRLQTQPHQRASYWLASLVGLIARPLPK
jgi:hypothetical protein